MDTSAFDYYLPPELIAQTPLEPRDASRLLLLNRSEKTVSQGTFRDIRNHLSAGDVLVLNDSRVIPARLYGQLSTGGKVEIFLLKPRSYNLWEALVRPGKKLIPGRKVYFGNIEAEIVDHTNFGGRLVRFSEKIDINDIQEQYGTVPLPPYIKEPLKDKDRYQTVFAEKSGSTAAPTAALHFTPELLQELRDEGVKITHITLHMGLSSFRPIKETVLENHVMESEYYTVSRETAEIINQAKNGGNKLIACGTDAVRTLETVALENGRIEAGEGFSQLFITPGYRFKAIDTFITNLHLPRSTHLVLVSAFAGREFVLGAYQYAIQNRFRFYSFGDATLVT